MWVCSVCSHDTRRRGNIIRHIKLVHGMDDREGENATKGEAVRTTPFPENREDTSNCLNKIKLHSGRPMLDEYPMSEEEEPHRPQPWVEDYKEEEMSRRQPGSITELAREFTQEQRARIGAGLKEKKAAILDCVLKILPINLKPRAKCICDKLMNTGRVWLNDKHEIIPDTELIPESNKCAYILELLTSCQTSGESIRPIHNDISLMKKPRHIPPRENKSDESRKSKECIDKSRNPKRNKSHKYESLYDNNVEYFDDNRENEDDEDTDSDDDDSDD